MDIEYEARVLEIDVKNLELKLKELNAEYKGEFFQKRYVYDVKPKREGKWIRLRSANNKSTLTIKDIVSDKIDGTKELEIEVGDFKKTNLILEELGYTNRSFQENKRKRYVLDGVEIDIDSWPFIPSYIEVEGNNVEEVINIIKKLGYKEEDIVTLDVDAIYKHYGYVLDEIRELRFEEE